MKPAVIVMLLAGSSACSSPSEVPSRNATPAAVALTAIPRAADFTAVDPKMVSYVSTGDLGEIANHSYLRVLVARSRTYFESSSGVQRGRAVDIGQALTSFLNEQTGKPIALAFIETPEDRLIADLLAGKGDIAANLLLTFERDDQVAFAKPIKTGIKEIVVTGPNEPHVVSLEDVGGRSIHVRASSDHYASLIRLNTQLKNIARPPARIVKASAELTDEDLLNLVNAGKIPATVADDYVYDACCSRLPGLKANRDVAVSQDGILAWVTRKDAPKLLALMNEFFSTHMVTFD